MYSMHLIAAKPQLAANPHKFQSMLFCVVLNYDDDIVENTDSMNILGIDIDKTLNLNDHIFHVCMQAYRFVATNNIVYWFRE